MFLLDFLKNNKKKKKKLNKNVHLACKPRERTWGSLALSAHTVRLRSVDIFWQIS